MKRLNLLLAISMALMLALPLSFAYAAPILVYNTVSASIASNNNLTHFESALKSSKLNDYISNGGPFTVFAPVNAAWAGKAQAISTANMTAADEALLGYIVPGNYTMAQLRKGLKMVNLLGQPLTSRYANGKLSINGAIVSGNPLEADNGAVYPLNQILPASKTQPASDMRDAVIAAATTDHALSYFIGNLDQLSQASRTSIFPTGVPVTVFASINAAFDSMPAMSLNSLRSNAATLSDVMAYHVALGWLQSKDMGKLDSLMTREGQAVNIHQQDGNLWVNDAEVLHTIHTANVQIYVIDRVLFPPKALPTQARTANGGLFINGQVMEPGYAQAAQPGATNKGLASAANANISTHMAINPGVDSSAMTQWNQVLDQALVTPLTRPSQLTGPMGPLAWSDAAVAEAGEYTDLENTDREAGVGPLTDGSDAWVIPGERPYDISQGTAVANAQAAAPGATNKGLASPANAAVGPLTDGRDSWVIPGERAYDFSPSTATSTSSSQSQSRQSGPMLPNTLGDQEYLTPNSTIGVP